MPTLSSRITASASYGLVNLIRFNVLMSNKPAAMAYISKKGLTILGGGGLMAWHRIVDTLSYALAIRYSINDQDEDMNDRYRGGRYCTSHVATQSARYLKSGNTQSRSAHYAKLA